IPVRLSDDGSDDKLERIGHSLSTFLRYIKPLALIIPRYAVAKTNDATLNRHTPAVFCRSNHPRTKVHDLRGKGLGSASQAAVFAHWNVSRTKHNGHWRHSADSRPSGRGRSI